MLQAMHARSRDITDPDAVELATWYHDAIYDPASTDNEARSADLLVAEMTGSQSPSSLQTAELMVRATADHIVPAGLPDAVAGDVSIFLDLDMAILGAEPAEYDVYEAGIAAEYVPIHGAAAYRSGRTAFLRMMLARDRLFHTDASHAELDARARANMRRALAGLEGPPRRTDGTATIDEPVETRDGPAMRPPAAVRIDEVARINREGWDRRVDDHDVWTLPVSPQDIGRARLGDWSVLLTPNKPVPRDWFGEVAGKDILCLASGGGQQGPILAAAGGRVTVFDVSPKQLAQDAAVASRDGLALLTRQGFMHDLKAFPDVCFDMVFHPASNCFAPDVGPVWRECFRVLKRRGVLMAGFMNPIVYVFDADAQERGELVVRFPLPYADVVDLSADELRQLIDRDHTVEFSHSLEAQIGGQLQAGFLLTHLFEDTDRDEPPSVRSRYFPTTIATRAVKP